MATISRAQWGARAPESRSRIADVRGMAVHYSAAEADRVADPNDCPARVRGIQRYHMDSNGWADIAYNFLVCRHGTIYEGRGWGIRSAANGTNDANDHWHAVCFLGADKEGRDDVTDPGRAAIHGLVTEGRRRYQQANEVAPHSAFRNTLCPGDELRAWIAAGLPLDAGSTGVRGSGPPTIRRTEYPQGEDMLTRHDIDIPALDGQGRGWVEVDVPAATVVSIVTNGPYPPVDNYWELPVVARQDRGGKTVVSITEGQPNGRLLLSVWSLT